MKTTAGRVVFFTGPTASGKTTIADAWAHSRKAPTAFIDQDHVRFLVRSGYVSHAAVFADPSLQAARDDQWLLGARVCEAMTDEYRRSGIDVALAAFRPPGKWKDCWQRLDDMDPLVVVLLPALEVVLARDEQRTGRAHTGEATVRRSYANDWSAWRSHPRAHVIDNSDLTIDATVHMVEALA